MCRLRRNPGEVDRIVSVRWAAESQDVRWAALSGAAFVVFFAIAVLLFGSGAGHQSAEIAAYYGDHGDRVRQIAGFYALGVAVLFFLWFAGVLSRILDAPLVLAAGTLTGALLLGADGLWTATAITVQHEQGFALDPSTHLIVEDAGFALFLAAMLAALGFVATASVAILRTRRLPTTLGVVGLPVAASLAAAWYYLPLFALLAWVLATSLLCLRRHSPECDTNEPVQAA